jgi:hypothetical protein
MLDDSVPDAVAALQDVRDWKCDPTASLNELTRELRDLLGREKLAEFAAFRTRMKAIPRIAALKDACGTHREFVARLQGVCSYRQAQDIVRFRLSEQLERLWQRAHAEARDAEEVGEHYDWPRINRLIEWCKDPCSTGPDPEAAQSDLEHEVERLRAENAELMRERGERGRWPAPTEGLHDKRYWLTPPEDYRPLNEEFGFTFDPCPYPRPIGFDGLTIDWGDVNYVNPPFSKSDAAGTAEGRTAFARKAIIEQQKGRTCVLILPTDSIVNLLLEAGAELRSMGRIPFLDVDTGERNPAPSCITAFILRGSRSD